MSRFRLLRPIAAPRFVGTVGTSGDLGIGSGGSLTANGGTYPSLFVQGGGNTAPATIEIDFASLPEQTWTIEWLHSDGTDEAGVISGATSNTYAAPAAGTYSVNMVGSITGLVELFGITLL